MERIVEAIINDTQLVDLKQGEHLDLIHVGEDIYHAIVNDICYRIQLVSIDLSTKHLELRINDQLFHVQLKEELDLLIDDMGFHAKDHGAADDINASMPGLVLDVMVAPGDAVEQDQAVLILEAMKMENVVKSSHPGMVLTVQVAKGDSVQKGDVLITFE